MHGQIQKALLTWLLAGSATCSALNAQQLSSLVDRMLESTVEAVEAALVNGDDDAAARRVVAAAQDYLNALGRSGERAANLCVLRGFNATSDGGAGFTEELVKEILSEVQTQRSRGRPHRMLPPLVVLFDRLPNDPRVLYALGEAFGILSPFFDAGRSRQLFEKLLEVVRDESELRVLSEFLPEMRATIALSEDAQGEAALWLRRHVVDYCDVLRTDKPIGLWRLADPRLKSLYEELILARRKLDQKRCRQIVDAMIAIQPINPVFHHAAAEIYCSYGPAFDKKKAAQHLDEFLRLTDPSLLGGPDDRRSVIMGRPEIARDLRRFQLAQPRDDLEELRVAARELRDGMRARKVTKRLLVPDIKDVIREFSKRSSELTRRQRDVQKLEASIEKNEKNLRKVAGRPKAREFRTAIARQRRRLSEAQEKVKGLQVLVDKLKELRDLAR